MLITDLPRSLQCSPWILRTGRYGRISPMFKEQGVTTIDHVGLQRFAKKDRACFFLNSETAKTDSDFVGQGAEQQ